MENILKYSQDMFYTDLISFSLSVIGLVISLWKHRQNPQLTPLIFFFSGYVLDLFFNFYILQNPRVFYRLRILSDYIDFLDTIVEFLAFFYLIKNHIISNKIKTHLNPLLPVFIGSVFIYFVYYKSSHSEIDQYFLQFTYTIQAPFLVIACVLYFIDLFTKEPKLDLSALPSFWAITGLAFFMLCTLPFSILGLYLIKTNYNLNFHLFSIFNIFYCLLFIMIIKAYLCKPSPVLE